MLVEPTIINDIKETQSRVRLNSETLADYAEAMRDGEEFPPVELFFDGKNYYLVDGFHRFAAHMSVHGENEPINADVIPGSLRDAILCSVSVNATHGLPRTNADKRRAVSVLLSDEEWGQWSSREIARRCRVSDVFVEKVRREFLVPNQIETRTYTQQGHVKTMTIDRGANNCTLTGGRVDPPEPWPVPPVVTKEVESVDLDVQLLKTGVRIADGWDSILVAWEDVPKLIDFFKRNDAELRGRCKDHFI